MPLNHQQERKIDDDLLLQMIGEGKKQKECAEHFNCSVPAISKRLKKLNPEPVEPLKIDAFSQQQQKFCIEIVSGASQTQAACEAYDVSSRASGKSLGSELMQQPAIREAIEELCNRQGLTKEFLVKRLRQHVASKDPGASLRGINMGLKLQDAFPAAKSMRLNVNIDAVAPIDLSKYRNK